MYRDYGSRQPIKNGHVNPLHKGSRYEVIVAQARRIIDHLSVQYVLEARLIREEIDGRFSIFSLSEDSERPDTVIGALFDRKVIIRRQ